MHLLDVFTSVVYCKTAVLNKIVGCLFQISNNLQPYLTFVMVHTFGVILSLFLDNSFIFWPQRTNTQTGRHTYTQLIEYIIDAENAYLIMLTSLNCAF